VPARRALATGDWRLATCFRRLAALFSAALTSVVLFAACGDDTSDVTTDASSLVPSKRDYVIQADTICANVQQGIETEAELTFKISAKDFTVTPAGEIVFKPGRRPGDAQIERFGTGVVIPAFREQLADLRALTPPSGDEAEVERIYAAAESGVDALEADPSLFADSDAVRGELSEARRLGRAYGFFDCGTYSAP
jgi:hypothetical protein